MKFKAFVIDLLVKLFFGDSPDVRYRRMIGFNSEEGRRAQTDKSYGSSPGYSVGYNADEVGRATKDSSHTTVQHYRYLLGFNHDEIKRQKQEAITWRNQVFEFPLILWGWGREKCRQYIAEITYLLELTEQEWVAAGRILHPHAIHAATPPEALLAMEIAPTAWEKSCCGYCPHSCSNGGDEEARKFKLRRSKRPKSVKLNQMILRWQQQPEMGGYAAYIEHNALAFSHYSGALYDSGAKKANRAVHTVVDKLKDAGIPAALQDYQRRVESAPTWSVYVVRRVFKEAVPSSEAAKAKARAKGRVAKPTYLTPPRYVKAIFTGSREEAHDYLDRLAVAYDKKPELVALSYRFWSRPRPGDESKRPFAEEMFVCVFSAAKDKWNERIDFEALWQSATGEPSCVRTPFDNSGE